MKLAKELAKRAKAKGICQEWHDRLLNLDDTDAMLDMYLDGIDFCLSNDYPSNEFIRANFKGKMEHKGIYLDDTVNVENRRKCVFLGESVATVDVTGFTVCEVFVKHDSTVAINAKDDSFVVVDVFDNSTVKVNADDRAKVCVNRYGGMVLDAMGNGTVKIREKHKKTY